LNFLEKNDTITLNKKPVRVVVNMRRKSSILIE